MTDRHAPPHRRYAAALVAATALLVTATAAVAPGGAGGQELPPETTSTTGPPTSQGSTTTGPGTTTTQPGGSTTTTGPGGTTTSTTVPPVTGARPGTSPEGDPVGAGDAGQVTVPEVDVTFPAAAFEAVAPGVTGAPAAIVLQREVATADLAAASAVFDAAGSQVRRTRSRLAAVDREIRALRSGRRDVVQRYADAKEDLATKAAEAYVQGLGATDVMALLLESEDPEQFGRKRSYLEATVFSVKESASEYRAVRSAADERTRALGEERADLSLRLVAAVRAQDQARLAVLAAGMAVRVFDAGADMFISGFVFPVAEPYQFIDSFGAPRMAGTGYAHYHEGTDIMAPAGTALFAAERGVITRTSSDTLGGTTIWLLGESGTAYYYAHLSAYAPGIAKGVAVEAGRVVGLVGNTGNARATAPHLHFEIHPDGGEAVNPYPLLAAVDDVNHGRPPRTTTTTTTTPGD